MRRILLCALVAACAPRATSPVSRTRFANLDPVWEVDDRRDVPDPPAERGERKLYSFDVAVGRRLDRALAAEPHARAVGTNALGEVPDSTWFENRVGVREVGLDELARGPGDGAGPDLSAPLRVVKGKSGGTKPGFIVEDASGVRWLVKPEPTGVAAESATDVAVQRLFWLIGYHVPENHPGYLRRDQVVVDDDATIKDARGRKRRMTEADLDAAFARAKPGADGRYRILASRFLPGTPIGGIQGEGVRADDPNDTIPHQRRRELRGLEVFAAWLSHSDFREMNTLEVWREDPADAARHVVFHYLVDFGNALGLATGPDGDPATARPDDGHVEQTLDTAHLKSLVTFGLWRRPWEGTFDPGIRGVGAFDVEHYDPGDFSPWMPFAAFLEADPADAFWAVRILLRITPAHIRAALEAGRYEDPRAVDYLTEVLVGRQRKTARYWLDRVSPLDDFEVVTDGAGDERLCFDDLVVVHDLDDRGAARRYSAAVFDWSSAALGAPAIVTGGTPGRRCTAALPRAVDHDGYAIVRLDVDAGGRALPAVEVHVARGDDRRLRVIGIERTIE